MLKDLVLVSLSVLALAASANAATLTSQEKTDYDTLCRQTLVPSTYSSKERRDYCACTLNKIVSELAKQPQARPDPVEPLSALTLGVIYTGSCRWELYQ